ncbi:MAG: S9 family peptidase, partial [Pyrinomonadaceae bacterium]|nr:S9 family peptidase [Pyrinomonadaceae bacterium]
MRKTTWLLIAVLALSSYALAQEELSIDKIYHPQKRLSFSGSPTFGMRWSKDGNSFVERKFDAGGMNLVEVNAKNGVEKVIYNSAEVARGLVSAGMSQNDAARISRRFIAQNDTTNSYLYSSGEDLFVYNARTRSSKRLTNNKAEELEADFSPDGKMVSFVRDNDLYVVEIGSGKEHRVTFDGTKNTLNGFLAWVYEEELYGRGQNRGYWWSPDSKYITFLKTDDSMVPMFVLADDTVTDQKIEDVGYPQAGDPNPTVKLAIVYLNQAKDFTGNGAKRVSGIVEQIKKQAGKVGIKIPGSSKLTNPAVKFIDLSRYQPEDFLISRVDWSPDSKNVIFQGQNREQTFLDLNSVNAETRQMRTLFQDKTKAWIDSPGNPYWLKDGSFVWRSPRSGFHHLYHYDANGKLIRQITKGNWEVRGFYGVDQSNDLVYFSGMEHSPIAPQIYRIRLDGSGLMRLTKREGSHRAMFNSTFTHFVNVWSDINTPPQTRLHRANGSVEKVINENKVELLSKYNLIRPEFMKVRNRDGFEMEAYMLKPPNFDPSRKYPVLTFVYGGPHAPQVRNRWGGSRYMYHQMLAQKGYIIWVCDPRSASGKGERESWTAYKKLGVTEQLDIEDGVRFLKRQSYVDPSRIGIWGWSYGGYMTLFAMTHSKSFKAGISVAPVTDYDLYDSIYTERFMLTPQ